MSIREEVIEALCQKSADIFGVDKSTLGPDTKFLGDLDAKSVDIVKYCSLLEDIYEVEVPFMVFSELETFADAAAFIGEMFGE